jgi:hypothetical protein
VARELDDERRERLGADTMKLIRSSIPNSAWFLRTERLTTATTTSSYRRAARRITSRCPFVIGSYEPGQTAIDLVFGVMGSGGL